jgi:site-specific recombinase XerD
MNMTPPFYSTLNDCFFVRDLAPHIDAFTDYLKKGRYAKATIKTYLACIAHFARWASQSHLNIKQLDETVVSLFLDDHLPHCDCPASACRSYHDLRAACGHLLRILRDSGIISEPVVATSPIEDELLSFDKYMCNVQGLATKTRSARIRIVKRLLQKQFTNRRVNISALQPADVRQFIAGQLEQCGTTSNASALASALRAYFRYRTVCGDNVHALIGVIALPAHWSQASLPRSLSPDEVDRLLASFTSDLPSPRRGYAIVRCALDMGLRASEIAKLSLSDIDWQTGTVMLRRTKSRREDIMPLPAVTGQAIANYLQFERPPTTNPAVFVRHRAPHDAPIGADAVRRVVRDAYHRIGLTHTRMHALRHSLASQLLEHGSSLKDVADILRHRSLNTSLIYAKLDNTRLRAVALPWPGSVS